MNRTRLYIGGAVIVVIAVAAIGLLLVGYGKLRQARTLPVATPASGLAPDHLYTCAELAPEHDKAEADARDNYARALAAKGLAPLTLESVDLGGPDGVESPDDIDKAMGRSARIGEVIPFEKDGKRRRAIVGELRHTEDATDRTELVADVHGGVWRVVRAPRVRVVKTARVKACSWGCWGATPRGDAPLETYHRTLWFLRDGDTFKGDLTIDYDEPTLDLTNTEQCSSPS